MEDSVSRFPCVCEKSGKFKNFQGQKKVGILKSLRETLEKYQGILEFSFLNLKFLQRLENKGLQIPWNISYMYFCGYDRESMAKVTDLISGLLVKPIKPIITYNFVSNL